MEQATIEYRDVAIQRWKKMLARFWMPDEEVLKVALIVQRYPHRRRELEVIGESYLKPYALSSKARAEGRWLEAFNLEHDWCGWTASKPQLGRTKSRAAAASNARLELIQMRLVESVKIQKGTGRNVPGAKQMIAPTPLGMAVFLMLATGGGV